MTRHNVFTIFREAEDEVEYMPTSGTSVNGGRKIKCIVKVKGGLKRASQLRRTSSDLTVHARPSDFEKYPNSQDIIGNSLRYKGRNYSIDGVSEGKNYETGEVEHYTFNCSLVKLTDDRPKFCKENDRNVYLITENGRPIMLEQPWVEKDNDDVILNLNRLAVAG